jgi:four helix bundle protein
MVQLRYDLEDRLLAFAVQACKVADRLPRTMAGRHAAMQLVRAATSPAANYPEAVAAESRRDFVHKLRICLKESRETRTWLGLVHRMDFPAADAIAASGTECEELIAIIAASIRTAGGTRQRQTSSTDH